MKTSDWMIDLCMRTVQNIFVNLRIDIEGPDIEGLIVSSKDEVCEFISSCVKQWRIIFDCLNQDVGDEKCWETIVQSELFREDQLDRFRDRKYQHPFPSRPLVDDEMKKDLFNFIDVVMQELESFCKGGKDKGSYNLYWEMDKVHNAPEEIFRKTNAKIWKTHL